MAKRKKKQKVGNKRLVDLQEAAVEKVVGMIKQGADSEAIIAQIDANAKKIAKAMTPAEKAVFVHPNGTLVDLDAVPASVLEDHLRRYTKQELERGQFIILEGTEKRYSFFMDQKTKERLTKERTK